MYPDPQNPSVPVPDTRVPPPLSDDTASGTLIITAGYGGRAFPLANVRAEVYVPAEESDPTAPGEVLYAVRETDESGIAPPLTVPAPDAALSESPGSAFLPFSIVRIRVFRDGFAPQEAEQVPVFAGIRSLQYFEMVPLSEGERYMAPGGVFTTVSDSVQNNL
ncbi:MAG: hypothetical protein E7604_05070 [Ruminococcaceae bacterium]|nr:hypothetical protein [Oscillospiraceae bacterium]